MKGIRDEAPTFAELGDKTCAYCGSALEPINIRVWQIQDIREE